MAGQNDLVLRVDHGLFRRTAEKVFGIAGKVLVQGIFSGHHDDRRFLPRTAHPAAALEGGHDRAGIAHQNADVQPADVYAQLQGAGADHGQQFARSHARFHGPALFRQKARAIGGNALLVRAGLTARPKADQFCHPPGSAIDDGAQIAGQSRLEQINGRCGRALFGIEKSEMPWPARGAGLINDYRRGDLAGARSASRADEPGRQLAGIAHRGRAEHIGGPRAVASGQAVQTAENLGHVRAEHAPVGVGLVHHHKAQTRQKGGPLFVVGQNAQMQHFRIADQHRGRVASYLAPEMVAGVAVIKRDRGAGRLGPGGGQGREGRQLILGQGLERKKIQRPRLGIVQMAFQHGQIINKALAAGRGCGHHHGMPGADVVCGQGLMAVQAHVAFFQQPVHGARPGQAAGRENGFRAGQQTMMRDLTAQPGGGQQRGHVFAHCRRRGRFRIHVRLRQAGRGPGRTRGFLRPPAPDGAARARARPRPDRRAAHGA